MTSDGMLPRAVRKHSGARYWAGTLPQVLRGGRGQASAFQLPPPQESRRLSGRGRGATALDLSTSRRAALLALLATSGPLPSLAKVDGIPLYAPGDQAMLPKDGFEKWLPITEQLRDSILPKLREAISNSDYETAAQLVSPAALTQQLEAFGRLASILGDEAYTALGIKSRYRNAATQLQKALLATPRQVGPTPATRSDIV